MKNVESIVRAGKFSDFGSSMGTERYHKLSLTNRMLASDGVKEMCEKLSCFWFFDVIASYYPVLNEANATSLCTAVFIRDGKGGGDFYLCDGDYNVMAHQNVTHTDLEEDLKVFIGPIDINPIRYLVYSPMEH